MTNIRREPLMSHSHDHTHALTGRFLGLSIALVTQGIAFLGLSIVPARFVTPIESEPSASDGEPVLVRNPLK